MVVLDAVIFGGELSCTVLQGVSNIMSVPKWPTSK